VRAPNIGILNDDDSWESTLVENLLPPLEDDPTVSLSFGSHWIVDADGRIDHAATDECECRYGRTGLAGGRYQPFGKLALVQLAIPMTAASLFRRDCIVGGPDDRAGPYYDRFLLYRLARAGGSAVYIPKRLSRYRVHDSQSAQTRHEENSLGCRFVIRQALDDGEFLSAEPGLELSLRQMLGRTEYRLGTVRLRGGRRRAALRHFMRASRLGHRRAVAGIGACCAPISLVRRLAPLR
jgi:hypothetical protein